MDPTIAAVHSAVCTAAVDVCVNKEMTRPAAVRSVFLLLGPPQAAAGVAKALTNGLPLSPVSSLSSSNPMESKKVWRKKETDCSGGDGNWRSAVKCFLCGSAIWLTTRQASNLPA